MNKPGFRLGFRLIWHRHPFVPLFFLPDLTLICRCVILRHEVIARIRKVLVPSEQLVYARSWHMAEKCEGLTFDTLRSSYRPIVVI